MASKAVKVKGWPPALVTPVPVGDVDRGDGDLAVDFVEALCVQVKDSVGGRAGEPMDLRPWQRNLIRAMYARRDDGRYRSKLNLVMLPRKSGKSALASSLALYDLFMGPNGGEVYSCAVDKDQARIVFATAKIMLERSPELSAQSKVYRDAIVIPATGSVYRVLSSDAVRKEGLSPTSVHYDELHGAPTRELFDVMSLAMAARIDARFTAWSTAGTKSDSTGQDSICYSLWQYGRRIAKREVDDPTFFMAWWGAAESADHRDPEVWKKANPAFGDLQDPEDFDSAVRRTPEAEFRTKRLNTWTSSQTAWLPAGSWDGLDISPAPTPHEDVEVILGFDGSFSGDASVVVGVTVEDEPRVFMVRAWEKQPTDRDDWRVDIGQVEQTIVEACGRWRVVEVACDPFRWSRSIEALEAVGVPVIEYASTSPARMVPATAKFYDAVTSGKIRHDGDPLLARHFQNCVLKVDQKGPRIVKEHRGSPRKIDAAVSAVMAFDRATMVREQIPESVPAIWVV